MSDLALRWNNDTGSADLVVAAGDLVVDDGLQTAIIISLFTDRRAADDDVLPQPGGDRRGWWGDTYAQIPGDLIGSRLWLLEREKDLPAVLARAQEYAQEALQWLLDDGVASSIVVTASSPKLNWCSLVVALQRPSGPTRSRFDFAWAAS